MVLTGGLNSPDFTDCAKSDADMTGDASLNILDVIQIINVILGNLNPLEIAPALVVIGTLLLGGDIIDPAPTPLPFPAPAPKNPPPKLLTAPKIP